MFSLVTHSSWQPIKTFVSAESVINLSDRAPKSKFQRPLAAALLGPWGMNASELPLLGCASSCLVPSRGTIPHLQCQGCSQEGAQQLGGIRALQFLHSFPPQSPELCCSHHNNPALRMSLIYTTWNLERGRENLAAMFWSTQRPRAVAGMKGEV